MVIKEKWFSDINLTDSATFPPDLTKHEKLIFNQKFSMQHKETYTYNCNKQRLEHTDLHILYG